MLDCCEHVLVSAAALVRRVLAGCEEIRVLCTSREPLGIPGEAVLGVGPLPPSDSHELYRRRAVAAGAEVPDHPVLEGLCTLLDHLPLAIEIAAAVGSAVGPDVMLEHLSGGGDLDAGHGRPVRHRSLAAAIEWSCALLEPEELATLAHLGAFAGAFDVDAAARAAGAAGIGRDGAVAALIRLVRRSLVVADDTRGRGRYHLLTAVRAHARRELGRRGWTAQASDAHLRWVLAEAAASVPHLGRAGQLEWFPRLDAIADEPGPAFAWAAAEPSRAAEALPVATGLLHWWMASGRRAEGIRWTTELARAATDMSRLDRVRALFNAGMMAAIAQLDVGPQLPADAMRLARGDGEAMLLAELFSATFAAMRGDLETSTQLSELCDRLPAGIVAAPFDRYGLFIHHLNAGDLAAGREVGRRMVAASLAAGDEHLAGGFMGGLIGCTTEVEEVRDLIRESRRIAGEFACSSCMAQAMTWEAGEDLVEDPIGHLAAAAAMADAIGDVAKVVQAAKAATQVLARAGRDEDAVALAAGAEATRARAGFRAAMPRREVAFEAGLRLASARLGPGRTAAAERRGRRLTPAQMAELLQAVAALPGRYQAPAGSAP